MNTLFQDMSFLKTGGIACFTGALSGQWTMNNFSPFLIPKGVFLISYAGEVDDLPKEILNDILKAVENDEIEIPIAKIYNGLEEVSLAQKI